MAKWLDGKRSVWRQMITALFRPGEFPVTTCGRPPSLPFLWIQAGDVFLPRDPAYDAVGISDLLQRGKRVGKWGK